MSFKGSLFILLLCIARSAASPIRWKPTSITVNTTAVHHGYLTRVTIDIHANRTIYRYPDDAGTFALSMQLQTGFGGDFKGQTTCFSTYTPTEELLELVRQTQLKGLPGIVKLARYAAVRISSFGDLAATLERTFAIEFDGALSNSSVSVWLNSSTCAVLTTIGAWNDGTQWTGEQAPSSTDTVQVGTEAGYIALESDVTINALTMESGTIVLHKTECPTDWVTGTYQTSGKRCYRKVAVSATFPEAQRQCVGNHPGTGSLARPTSSVEADLAKRLCRQEEQGCWIGLIRLDDRQRFLGDDTFRWVDAASNEQLGSMLYGPWARREPNNSTLAGESEGCVLVKSWERDFTAQLEPRWNDVNCQEKHAFICERAGITQRYVLTVSGAAWLGGGGFQGSGRVSFKGSSIFADANTTISIAEGASVLLAKSSHHTWSSPLVQMTNGGRIEVLPDATLTVTAPSTGVNHTVIGEAAEHGHLPPEVVIHKNGTFLVTSGSNIIITAQLTSAGSIKVDQAVLKCTLGGDLHKANISISSGGQMVLPSGSMLMHSEGRVDLFVLADRTVVGPHMTAKFSTKGVYRLGVRTADGSVARTACIPFSATARELGQAIQKVGTTAWDSLTIRRLGDGTIRSNYGFHYEISYDYGFTGAALSIACIGNSTGCLCTDIAESPEEMMPTRNGDMFQSAFLDPAAFVEAPQVSVSYTRSYTHALLHGNGKLIVHGGMHRLPPASNIAIEVLGGEGLILSNAIDLKKTTVSLRGTLSLGGAGIAGLDAIQLLNAPAETPFRAYSSYIQASKLTGTITELIIQDRGAVFAGAASANLTVAALNFTGGTLQGRLVIIATDATISGNNPKQMRDRATLICPTHGTMIWLGGSVLAREASTIDVYGAFYISAHGATFGASVGDEPERSSPKQFAPHPLQPISDTVLFDYSTGRRQPRLDGTYLDPRCGDQCTHLPILVIRPSGSVIATNDSRASLDVDARVYGLLHLESNSSLALSGELHMADTSQTLLDGNSSFHVSAKSVATPSATITGQGVFALHAPGSLVLPASTDAHLEILDGVVNMTLLHHSLDRLTMFGGLISVKERDPASTITINKHVGLHGGRWEFPQYTRTVRPLFTETASADVPSHTVHIKNSTLAWSGGTIVGSVNIYASRVELSGTQATLGPEARIFNLGHGVVAPSTHVAFSAGADFLQDQGGTMQTSSDSVVGSMLEQLDGHTWE